MMTHRRQEAFTLVELMVVVSIAAILITAAMPSFRASGANTRADNMHKMMLGDINYSRYSARDLSATVQMIPRENSWDNGWVVTVVNGAPLRVRAAIDDQIDITSDDFKTATPIEFNNQGRATTLGSVKITTKGCTGDRIRTLTINVMGQVRTTETGPCPGL